MWQQLKNYYHFCQAIFAQLLYGFPSRNMTILGVTGTDGKTTTAMMLYTILRAAGKKTAVITTIGAYINDKNYTIGTHVTTPSPFTIHKLLRIAKRNNVTHVILETTSHALDQNRVAGIHYAIGILTNITPEHLDYHKTFERYQETKFKLLHMADLCVINRDDASYETVIQTFPRKKCITYSAVNQKADITPHKNPFTLQLLGTFNVLNALAAYAAARQLGIDETIIRQALETFKAPQGRQEIVYDEDFRVIVDFAHTPHAMEQVLKAARATTTGRLIAIFGSAGKRDTKKRPAMGAAAARYADIIILTADDPRDENVSDINAHIAEGIAGFTKMSSDLSEHVTQGKKVLIETTERQIGINCGIALARPGDTVVLAGIGHVEALAMKEGDIPWSEKEAVEKALTLQKGTH